MNDEKNPTEQDDKAAEAWENAIVDAFAEGVPELHPDNRRPTAREFVASFGLILEFLDASNVTPAKVAALVYVTTMLSQKITHAGPVAVKTVLALVQATEKVHVKAKRNLEKLENGETVDEERPA
jgi:hypothetical protein